ncbi:MAG: hypothetical protein EBT46_02265 [Actinobacteria bacterium]|nr:hypothetical protein [Actinomycetota bacterium]
MPLEPSAVKSTDLTSFTFLGLLMSTMSMAFFAPFVTNSRFDSLSTAEISAPARPTSEVQRPTKRNSEPFTGTVSAPAEEAANEPAATARAVDRTAITRVEVFIARKTTTPRFRRV